jgi:5-methylthioadenosine/S-adenosylhomocysteine deaminase
MKLASGVAPIGALQKHHIPVALGTDGPASNNAQNMLREMYVASLLQKVSTLDPTACPAQTALDMATRGGSAALHDPHIGTLEPGMKADFIALDLSAPNMQPVHNIVSNIVYAATGAENKLTVVDGKELYRDGKFLTCDFEALSAEIQKARAWVRS